MTTTAHHRHRRGGTVRPGVPRPSRTGTRSLFGLLARVRGPWLDAQLATGVAPWSSPVHSARSLQITSPRARRELAGTLDKLIARAALPEKPAGISAVVPLDRPAVLGARPVLEMLMARLRADAPVSTQGVAALRQLLCDGAGPLYGSVHGESLLSPLAEIYDTLDVDE